MQDIYQRASSRLGDVLSPDELTKFQEFQTTAIKNNRSVLSLNRTMMASLSQLAIPHALPSPHLEKGSAFCDWLK